MTAYKIDHIGVAVVSIDDALAVYRALGLEERHREEVPAQKVVTAFLPAGESRIELLEPTSEDSPVAKFLKKRGPGIHHVCFAVRDIDGAVADLATARIPSHQFRVRRREPTERGSSSSIPTRDTVS